MIVADAGPLIAFAHIGRLELLRQVVGEIAIPDAVYQELVVAGRRRTGAAQIAQSQWIQRRSLSESSRGRVQRLHLHPGESEAIALARELRLPLLIDERRGRASAKRQGVTVIGTLWVLAEAKRRHVIIEVRPLVEELRASGYWMDSSLVRAFLREVDEAPQSD